MQPRRRLGDLAADLGSVTGARFSYLVVAFVAEVFLARSLGPSGKGLLAAALVYPLLLLPLFELGIRQASVVLLGGRRAQEPAIVGSVALVWLIVSPLAFLLALALTRSSLAGQVGWLPVVLAAMLLPIRLLVAYGSGLALGAGRIDVSNLTTLTPPVGLLAFAFGISVVSGLTLSGALAAYVGAGLIAAGFGLRFVLQRWRVRVRFEPGTLRSLLKLGLVFALSLTLVGLNYRADIAILARLRPDREVGLYAVATQMSESLLQLPAALGVVVFARSAATPKRKVLDQRLATIVGASFVASIIAASLLGATAGHVVRFVFGANFGPSAPLLVLLLPGTVLVGLFKLVAMDFAGRGRPWLSVLILAPTVTMNIGLNLLLIPRLGAAGAAVASSAAYCVTGAVGLGVFLRIARLSVRDLVPTRARLRGLIRT